MMTGKGNGFLRRLAVFSASALVLAVVLGLFYGPASTDRRKMVEGGSIKPEAEEEKYRSGAVAGRYHRGAGISPFYLDPFCGRCHPSPAHQRDASQRSLLNHHTVGIHCLICHGRDFMDHSGMTVLREMEDGRRILWPTRAGRLMGLEEVQAWRDQVTGSAECFPPGPKCVDCHRPGGLLDFDELGYEKERAGRLKKMEEFLILRPGQRWFFPEVF